MLELDVDGQDVQATQLRQELHKLRDKQFVYISAGHWRDVPHVAWDLLDDTERRSLQEHFSGCGSAAQYVRGDSKLPPRVPGT